METPTQNEGVESSPAPAVAEAQVPTDRKAYDTWRQTGKIEAPKKSSDAKPADAGDGQGDEESRSAAESETGKKQEHKPGKAEARLNELLEDLKRAGLTPSELKSFKREAAKAAAEPESKPKAATEHTEKPADDKAPKRPKESDYKTWEEYEAAKDEYIEKLADYKAQQAVESDRAERRKEAAQKEMQERLNAAKARYGEDADQTIVKAAKEIFTGDSVPPVIRQVLNESDHLVDVLYALGKDGGDLEDFLAECKTSPGKAMRRAVLVEKLVMEELAKGGGGKAAAGDDAPERDSDGKFKSSKKETKAPPPPRETSGRNGPPADERESAAANGDFRAFRAAANRRDLATRRGN